VRNDIYECKKREDWRSKKDNTSAPKKPKPWQDAKHRHRKGKGESGIGNKKTPAYLEVQSKHPTWVQNPELLPTAGNEGGSPEGPAPAPPDETRIGERNSH